jgi:hypothetical protein
MRVSQCFQGVSRIAFSVAFLACSNSDTTANTPADGGNSSDHLTSDVQTVDSTSGGDTGPSSLPDASSQSDTANPASDASSPSDAAHTGSDGSANAGPDGGACTGTQILCGAACVEPATDRAHCGGCATGCANNQTCVSGLCTRVTCEAGTTACAGMCVDTQTDNAHCGGCNMSCGAGATCTAGHCACAAAAQVNCPTLGCFDITTDPNHCGGCNNSCGPGGTCASGTCTCASGISACGNGCANLATDPNNCGHCGRQCAMGTIACVAGQCQMTGCDGGPCCAPGHIDCSAGGRGGNGRGCIDPLTDPANCGICGTACDNSPMGMCVAGKCI